MAYDGLSRISVCVLDEGGLLQVRGDDAQYCGVLPRVPPALSIGDTAHVRLSLPATGASDDATVDLLGVVCSLEGGPGPVALKDGLIFEVDVEHVNRRPGSDASLTMPAPDDAGGEEEALPDEPFEAPIHFRAVDVERREAVIEPEALYGPAPISGMGAAVEEDEDPSFDEEALRAAALERARQQQSLAEARYEAAVAPPPVADDGLVESAEYVTPAAVDDVDDSVEEEVTVHQRSGSRRSARAVFEATEPSGVVGTLREMPLTEVVQSMSFSGKTAEIDVRPKESDVPPGVVFLERGNVVYARCGTLEGEDAFFALADQRRGAFLIRFHAQAPTVNVERPTAFLLLEALRRKDEENHERDLVEAVAEEAAAEEAFREDDACDDTVDRTLLSPPDEEPGELSLAEPEGDASRADPGVTEPFARIPSRKLERAEASVLERAPDEVDDDVEYELDDDEVEEALVAVESVDEASEPRAARPYATAMPTTIFSRFFEEASEEDAEQPPVAADEDDDISDPTFSGLKAALKGLKGGEDDTLAAFDRPVSTGSYPSYS